MRRGSALLSLVESAGPITPPKKGRLLGVNDIQAILPARPDGTPVTRWWVNHCFCRDQVIKIGRQNMWYEDDAWAWINAQSARSA
jgi:hypothetical protein